MRQPSFETKEWAADFCRPLYSCFCLSITIHTHLINSSYGHALHCGRYIIPPFAFQGLAMQPPALAAETFSTSFHSECQRCCCGGVRAVGNHTWMQRGKSHRDAPNELGVTLYLASACLVWFWSSGSQGWCSRVGHSSETNVMYHRLSHKYAIIIARVY